jgi:hypothetical protein
MNRANIQNIDKVFEEIGFVPCQNAWLKTYEAKNQCCGLSALMIKDDIEFPGKIYGISSFKVVAEIVQDKFNFTSEYIIGFVHGFDNYTYLNENEEYNTGYDDGKTAWNKVKHLVEVKQ